MQLEEGKTYLTRGGWRVTVTHNPEGVECPWKAVGGKVLSWTNDGKFFTHRKETELDIVSEVINTPATPARIPHPHAKEIHAFADGYEIEYENRLSRIWTSTNNPIWKLDIKYRVKPEPVPNVVNWQNVFSNGGTGNGFKNKSACDSVAAAILRVEINNNDPATDAQRDIAIGLILQHLGMTIVETNATKHGTT